MKILIVCKRQYTGKDLIDDQYGRLFEIPEELSLQGHQIQGICISYRKRDEGKISPRNVEWLSINSLPFFGTYKILKSLRQRVKDFKPDLLWVSSDVLTIIVAALFSQKEGIPFVADLYDNYESFGLARIPFVRLLFKQACRQAKGISVVTEELLNLVHNSYDIDRKKITVIGNAINPDVFFPIDKIIARKELGLPQNAFLIGTAGALDASRGINILFEALDILKREQPNLHLVIAGRLDRSVDQLSNQNIIYLGELSQRDVALLFNSLNLAIICNLDSSFGRYCYPQKYNEIIACETPVLAADVGEMRRILSEQKYALFNPLDPSDLADKIKNNIRNLNPVMHIAKTWKERAEELNKFILQLPL